MNKLHYGLAVCTFIVFCLLWASYDTPFIEAFDRRAFDVLYDNKLMSLFHYIGETKFIFAFAIIILFIIWARKKDYRLMVIVLLSLGGGYGLYQFLKRVIERPRPDIVDQLLTFSFPSGHAVHGLLCYFTIAYVVNRLFFPSKRASLMVWVIAILVTLLIGISRITEARHFASDVIAGWSLGYSWFVLCLWWYKANSKKVVV